MKNLALHIVVFLLIQFDTLAQVDNQSIRPTEPLFFEVVSHDSNFENIPEKSFYKSKNGWQYTIDTTWGPGLPLAEKQQIFNAYATSIREQFDGFESLQMNLNSWDSLRAHYYSMIDDSTSKGGFSAIMSHFSMQLKDAHTRAYDESVVLTPLNPGIPVLVTSAFSHSIAHFGAVVTVLPDSSLLVLRTVANHPLDLQPGDILLGYEGTPWKILVNELLDAGLPMVGLWGGAQSAHSDALLLGAGLNWHLFETIDILKHSTGDTLHLSVYPLLNLPPENMLNNEQLSVPGVPFPNFYNQQYVSYGIIDGTNIGYIYLCAEVQGTSDQQFYEAVIALKETDALIIDMRLNVGGWAFFNSSLEILFNESHLTIEDAYRCNINDFTLCPSGNSPTFKVPGNPPAFYDRPIAIFLGPTCASMGDVTAQRFRYHPTVRFFGKSSAASLGDNVNIVNFPNWHIKYSISDMYHVNAPGEYLNRREFPIDYPVWFNPDDVANGYDTVVEEALEWINNLVYPHNIIADKTYYSPEEDTVHLSTIIENPNSHQISARGYIHNLYNVLIDSVDFVKQNLNTDGENWSANLTLPQVEEYYKVSVTAFDQTTSDHFKLPNATRFTTMGPVTLDSVFVLEGTNSFSVKPFLKNHSTDSTITNASVKLTCNDPWVTSIAPAFRYLPNIPPGAIVSPVQVFTVTVDTSVFPDYFNFEVNVLSDSWPYWTDSMRIPPIAIISINPTELDFGEVAIDSAETKTFTITNYGDEDLVISNITSSEPVFTVNITSAVVPPDSSQSVEVTFTPTGAISFNGKIEITHNAAGSPDSVTVTGDGVTGVEDELQPLTYSLEQNYPNPFNPNTVIKYSIPEINKVMLKLYNLLGEEVATLVNEEKVAGYYKVEFNAATLPSGVYFYQLVAKDFVITKKMILMK